MSIFPLPVFEADADPHHRSALSDEEIYARIEAPKTIVVRFGYMKLVGEYAYDGDAKPGCGSKLIARTHRGTEVVEMLTTTCENAGCAKSVTRKEMRQYIEDSGGHDFPFFTNGKILRVASIEDLNRHSEITNRKGEYLQQCKELIRELQLNMKLVEVEPILGGELLTFFYMAEDRVDFRTLVMRLASEFKARIEMRQVGARDEARLVADFERCGQHCCCKNFLKVLKPISMRAAKMQKATLDPLKISGRCGRLMCCLRYEDQTYKELKANLPHRKTRVGTSEGPGLVLDSRILTQLVLVQLEDGDRQIAVPVEELMDPDECPAPGEKPQQAEPDALRGMSPEEVQERADDGKRKRRRRRGRRRSKGEQQDAHRARSQEERGADDKKEPRAESKSAEASGAPSDDKSSKGGRKRRRRGRRKRRRGGGGDSSSAGN
jgi:cell fate regulator YaaT (PSP1 superfamily)